VSLLERVEDKAAASEIEPGKRLIRAGDDRGLSLFERLNLRLHRIAWQTPMHRLRLRGRMPLKLIAVPKDPIAGDKEAGEALLAGHFSHNGTEVPIDAMDSLGLPEDFTFYLHSFAWLRDLSAAATRERGAKRAEGIARAWLAAHGERISEPAWRADLWGRRILFWTAYAPYILSSHDPVYRSSLLYALARGARHLERTADKAPAGLPRMTAWSGVIAAALVVQGGPARLKSGEAGLSRAFAASLHDDGGLVSRAPAEQLAMVELLGQLRAVYTAARREAPEWLIEALTAGVGALLSVTMGDEALSSWQGGNKASRRRVTAAAEGAGLDAAPLRQARGWGYQRVQARNSVLVFDAAPPPPPRALKGACASTLAFEFSDGPSRLIVNCGGAGEARGALPAALVHALRTTAAHSTLALGDKNSTAIHEDGALGKGVSEVELVRDDTAGSRIEASHDGYVKRYGLLHERRLNLTSDGRQLTGEDRLIAAGRRRRAEPIPFAIRFHLAPGIEATPTADGQGALLRLKGAVWQFRCRGGRLAAEDSLWIDGEARPHATLQLVVTGESPGEGMTISWELKRAS